MNHIATEIILAFWRVADLLHSPKRVSRKRVRLIASLGSVRFARAASTAALPRSGVRPQFEYNPENSLFALKDHQTHFFAHCERVNSYLAGLEARGEKLAKEYLLDQVPFGPGDNIVDIGANVGDLALAIQSLGIEVNLTAFEPSPREFAALERNLASNSAIKGFKAFNAAVWSDDDDQKEFYVKSATADSSIIPIDGYDETISVPTVRLDTVLPKKTYKLLKLEAEGAEPEILLGASQILSCFQFVSADVGFERGLRQESTLPEVTRILVEHGFHIKAVGRDRLILLFERTTK